MYSVQLCSEGWCHFFVEGMYMYTVLCTCICMYHYLIAATVSLALKDPANLTLLTYIHVCRCMEYVHVHVCTYSVSSVYVCAHTNTTCASICRGRTVLQCQTETGSPQSLDLHNHFFLPLSQQTQWIPGVQVFPWFPVVPPLLSLPSPHVVQ